MIEILYLAKGRPEFTKASCAALHGNTDGRKAIVHTFSCYDSPIEAMAAFIPGTSEVFAKIDNDVIVPPGWLETCLAVMEANPRLELLGIEPPLSRNASPRPRPIDPAETSPGPLGYCPCEAIGGIGLMRRSAFESRPPMVPHSVYGGFTDWQLKHKPVCGWIAPPLKVFLLDRLPIEPWASLSKSYIAQGQQRFWQNYKPEDHELWDWWLNTTVDKCSDSATLARNGA